MIFRDACTLTCDSWIFVVFRDAWILTFNAWYSAGHNYLTLRVMHSIIFEILMQMISFKGTVKSSFTFSLDSPSNPVGHSLQTLCCWKLSEINKSYSQVSAISDIIWFLHLGKLLILGDFSHPWTSPCSLIGRIFLA